MSGSAFCSRAQKYPYEVILSRIDIQLKSQTMDIVGEAGLRWSKFLPQSSLISNVNTIGNVILYVQARSLPKITVVSRQIGHAKLSPTTLPNKTLGS